MFKASNFLNYYVIFLVQGSLFLFSVLLFFLLLKGNSFLFALDVYSLKSLHLSLDFILDKESILFFLSLSAIICGVFTYSASYMAGEKYFNRFMGTLSLFALSMMVLIFSGNYFSLMIGWDGLGVTSFLLVIFFQNKNSTNAGLLTVFTNRIGDVFIMTSMGLLLVSSSWSIASFAAMSVSFPPLLSMLMILAAFTKSAQIPFSSWLPAAMAAPTPVSSLVHSSTLVTAGVYLLFRFKDVFMTSSSLSGVMLLSVGSSTMMMAGLAGMYEDDLKKMVALSTLSQLGLMISCLGLSAPQLAFFHLLSHAYFKALLFMATGSMIHSVGGYQDLRVMRLPFSFSSKTSALLIISNLSLMGLPFLSGFYSKDLMLETAMSGSLGLVSAIMFILGTALTVLYSSRFVILSSSGGLLRSSLLQHLDQDWLMFKGYDFLFFLAIAGGSGLNYLYLEAGPSLSLSFEFKNSILLLIAGMMSFYLVTQFQPTQSLKKVIGRLLNLSLLSKSFMKNWLFFGVLSNESLIEKFSLKMGMFASLMLALTSPRSLDSRSLMIFWGVSGLLGGSLVLI